MGEAPPNNDAHHMVGFGDKRVEELRTRLEQMGIDINDPVNGVWVPNKIHKRMHTNDYYNQINADFRGITTKEEALQVLEKAGYQ